MRSASYGDCMCVCVYVGHVRTPSMVVTESAGNPTCWHQSMQKVHVAKEARPRGIQDATHSNQVCMRLKYCYMKSFQSADKKKETYTTTISAMSKENIVSISLEHPLCIPHCQQLTTFMAFRYRSRYFFILARGKIFLWQTICFLSFWKKEKIFGKTFSKLYSL